LAIVHAVLQTIKYWAWWTNVHYSSWMSYSAKVRLLIEDDVKFLLNTQILFLKLVSSSISHSLIFKY